jgi:hypothetical protein
LTVNEIVDIKFLPVGDAFSTSEPRLGVLLAGALVAFATGVGGEGGFLAGCSVLNGRISADGPKRDGDGARSGSTFSSPPNRFMIFPRMPNTASRDARPRGKARSIGAAFACDAPVDPPFNQAHNDNRTRKNT